VGRGRRDLVCNLFLSFSVFLLSKLLKNSNKIFRFSEDLNKLFFNVLIR